MKAGIGTLVLAVALMAPAAPALGGSHWPAGLGRHHGKFWKREEVRRELQLTEDEVRNLEHIFAKNQQPLIDLAADVKKKRADLETLLVDDRADDKRITAQVDLVEQARANLGKARVMMLLEMRKALTPAQREKLVRLKEEHERRKGREGGERDRGAAHHGEEE